MTTNVKRISTMKSATNWKHFTSTAMQKISENIMDMVLTVAACGMLIAYLNVTQPIAAIEYSGYIIAVHVLILLRRLVHDFDDSWTIEEVGDRVSTIESKLEDVARMVKEDTITEQELIDRLNGVTNNATR